MHLHIPFTVSSAQATKPEHGQAISCMRPGGGAGRVEGFRFVPLVSSHDVLHEIVAAHDLNVQLDAGYGTSKYT